ncbi:GNAT family N-acetyltransferase [Methanobacterium alcaliphilum]|uniref:GNAT family N-acetyltransferase n=1 Tax=Methanobacterium alcaliphilum TaxID=392018 RepID=UPI00200B80F0|nr:GNAT family N-acetyltransferase [Methanobacterium alcaliphilum]MCK9150452.1 GNAT family N-acetyltransferase [Methanobacterium alcaliphilum]
MISLKKASLKKRKETYEWLYYSDFSPFLNRLQGYSEKDIPTYSEFKKDYADYFFNDTHPDKGRGFLIIHNTNYFEEEIGFISYTTFHLKPGFAELDIWLKSLKYTGKEYGISAINLLSDKLSKNGYHTFIMRPSKKNIVAINAYKKAGFNESNLEAQHYYKKDFLEEYCQGDYGPGQDIFLVKHSHPKE